MKSVASRSGLRLMLGNMAISPAAVFGNGNPLLLALPHPRDPGLRL